jgi:hypothetical protein
MHTSNPTQSSMKESKITPSKNGIKSLETPAVTPKGSGPGKWLFVTGPSPDEDEKSSISNGQATFTNSDAPFFALPAVVRGMNFPIMGKSSPAKSAGGLPPRLDLNPTKSQVYRFKTTAAETAGVHVGDLLGVIGGVATVANSKIAAIASSVRLRKVTVWPPGSISTSASSVSLEWAPGSSSQVPDDAVDRTIPLGITATGALSFVPPKMSLASFWITSADSTATVFLITAPAGAVIDVHLDYKISMSLEPLLITVATATLGNYYYLALDGAANNKYVPSSGFVSTTS